MHRACFLGKKTPEFTKVGEIHELFVLALSLVWFGGATPDSDFHAQTPASPGSRVPAEVAEFVGVRHVFCDDFLSPIFLVPNKDGLVLR